MLSNSLFLIMGPYRSLSGPGVSQHHSWIHPQCVCVCVVQQQNAIWPFCRNWYIFLTKKMLIKLILSALHKTHFLGVEVLKKTTWFIFTGDILHMSQMNMIKWIMAKFHLAASFSGLWHCSMSRYLGVLGQVKKPISGTCDGSTENLLSFFFQPSLLGAEPLLPPHKFHSHSLRRLPLYQPLHISQPMPVSLSVGQPILPPIPAHHRILPANTTFSSSRVPPFLSLPRQQSLYRVDQVCWQNISWLIFIHMQVYDSKLLDADTHCVPALWAESLPEYRQPNSISFPSCNPTSKFAGEFCWASSIGCSGGSKSIGLLLQLIQILIRSCTRASEEETSCTLWAAAGCTLLCDVTFFLCWIKSVTSSQKPEHKGLRGKRVWNQFI